MEQEIWKDIPDYEGLYQVSNFGRIKSLGNDLGRKEKILKPWIGGRGRHQAQLCVNYKIKWKLVHRLVAQCFLGFTPTHRNIVVDHKDNDCTNNHVDNLQVITQRLNASKDRYRQNHSSKYVGVSWVKKSKKWMASIRDSNSKPIYLGLFENEYDAHLAYQKSLKEITELKN